MAEKNGFYEEYYGGPDIHGGKVAGNPIRIGEITPKRLAPADPIAIAKLFDDDQKTVGFEITHIDGVLLEKRITLLFSPLGITPGSEPLGTEVQVRTGAFEVFHGTNIGVVYRQRRS